MPEKEERYKLIYEHSLNQKLKIAFAALVISLLIVGVVFTSMAFLKSENVNQSPIGSVTIFVKTQIINFTLTGIFLTGFIASLFFSFVPLEPAFYYGLMKGNPIFLSCVLIMAGLIPAEMFNYIAGRKFSGIMRRLVSTQKIYEAKRFVNRHGSYGIFLFNFIPIFPSPILTFALGIVKYNPTRLFFWLLLGDILKFIAMALLYYYIGAGLESFL